MIRQARYVMDNDSTSELLVDADIYNVYVLVIYKENK